MKHIRLCLKRNPTEHIWPNAFENHSLKMRLELELELAKFWPIQQHSKKKNLLFFSNRCINSLLATLKYDVYG